MGGLSQKKNQRRAHAVQNKEEIMNEAGHVSAAAEALAVFQHRCGADEHHAIADLIFDLGHLAAERDIDFLAEVKRGLWLWCSEDRALGNDQLGRDAFVEISVTTKCTALPTD
jgi:hypothetical protein